MKRCIMMLTAVAVFSCLAWAQDGSALYKSKCAACHGPMGEGKMGPSLQTTKLSQDQIKDLLMTGGAGRKAPHTKAMAGLTADQAAQIATFVAGLKK